MLKMMENTVDVVVVGGGIVGIAVARELAQSNREVVLLEQERAVGEHQSSRNSGVIHGGFHYAVGSLKARLCHPAKLALYRYAETRSIPHRRVGKLVVATDEAQRGGLETILHRAEACGINDLRLLDARDVARMEPELACVAALWSPSTGIIDTTALLLALYADAQDAGVTFATRSQVLRGERAAGLWRLYVASAGTESVIACRVLVNSAGLGAVTLARNLDGYPTEHIPDSYLARGNYFSCQGGAPFSRLVYPLPDNIGLGLHLTLDMAGQVRFGPDVELVDRIDYNVQPGRVRDFYAAIRRYWPGLPDGSLSPDYAGIRAKTGRPGDPQDWRIDSCRNHGVPGLVNLFGMETPGMTCSMAIAREVAARVCEESFA